MTFTRRLFLYRLRKLLRGIFVQGKVDAMEEFAYEVYAAAASEFREDNQATVDGYLADLFRLASERYRKEVLRAYDAECGSWYPEGKTSFGTKDDVTCPKCLDLLR